jgi:2-isopropylmalate synthase
MTERIIVFDTTLRDGEQAAGSRLDAREKLEIARQLVRLGVDVIEAGFPCSSPQDFAAVELIAKEIQGPVICGLTRAVAKDIDACGQALAPAVRSRIHTGLGVSDIHIAGKFGDEKYGRTLAEKKVRILQMAAAAVRHARGYTDDVEFYAEDSGRADRTYLFEVLQAVIEAGATVVNIPDTTGYALPAQYGALIRDIRTNVPGIDQAMISVHCHDDLGLATANTLAGIENGARQIECTINGIGERAGNAALEEAVMAIRTRRDFFRADTGITSRELYRTSRLVADLLGMTVPANKAIIGGNAFAHSSGIHVDGFLKKRATYEIIHPEEVGCPQARVVLTARTGRHGVRHRLEELGYDFSSEEIERIYQRFLNVADKKKEVYGEDLIALVQDEIRPVPDIFRLESLKVQTETGTSPAALVRLCRNEEIVEQTASGDGPVDAVYKAIARAAAMAPQLRRYEIQAITGGSEAIGQVTVQLEMNGLSINGRGASTDIIEASARAYIDGLNKLVGFR